jgi:hypothetical protein
MTRYYTWNKIFLYEITFIVSWVKKRNSKRPMTRYYSLYICNNFVFFALATMGIISFPNIFFTSTNLIILGFQEDSTKKWFFLNYYNFFGVWRCVIPESQKSFFMRWASVILPTSRIRKEDFFFQKLNDVKFNQIIF